MNRRTFFKNIGAAILGTAIALELPDSIVPKVPELLVSENPDYAFGFTGFYPDDIAIKGHILAHIKLQVLSPRIYIENC